MACCRCYKKSHGLISLLLETTRLVLVAMGYMAWLALVAMGYRMACCRCYGIPHGLLSLL